MDTKKELPEDEPMHVRMKKFRDGLLKSGALAGLPDSLLAKDVIANIDGVVQKAKERK